MKTPLLGSHIALVSNAPGSGTSYSNTGSGLTATDVQAAIDELVAGITGAYVLVKDGGKENITAHGNTGATETFFASGEGNVHTATLNAATVTFTFAAVTAGKACSFTMWLTQDVTGGRLVTWPGSVVWQGGTAPVLATAAAAVDVLTFFTLDGGTVWYGFHAGAGSSLIIKEEGTPLATDATSLDFVGAGVVASGAAAAKTITISGAPTGAAGGDLAGTYPNPTITAAAVQAASPSHAHVAQETHTSDGATVLFTLDQTYEPGSVMSHNLTTGHRLGITETLPDQATVSAAGTAGDQIVFDYAASFI